MLIGRSAEQARVRALLAGARRGRAGTLLLYGAPGVGKTALLRDAVERAEGFCVVRARGVESETDLAFAGLLELLRPVLAALDRISPGQADALRGALALGPAAIGDRFAVYAATLSLLAAAAEETPVLVVVDDAHWLDPGSLEALLFAARRLDADRVAMVFAAREGEGTALPGSSDFETLTVAGLDAESGEALVRESSVLVAKAVARRLVRATSGNPLALLELPALLSAAQLQGSVALDEPLPTSASIERAYARRAAALSAAGQRALLVAASLGSGEIEVLARALELLGIPGEALEEAESARLIQIVDGRFEFSHPLVRSALYQAAPAGERRAAHRALADALSGEADADRCAWHLAAATSRPDEQVAARLDASAERALTRAGFAAAGTAWERAAALSPGAEERARRLVKAADAAQRAGAGEHALALLEAARACTGDRKLRAEIQNARAFIAFWRGDYGLTHDLLAAEAPQLESLDPELAAVMYAELTGPAFQQGEPERALAMARRSLQLADGVGTRGEFMAAASLGLALLYAGHAADAAPHMRRSAEIAERDPAAVGDPVFVGIAAECVAMIEEFDRARTLLQRLAAEARGTGSLGVLTWVLDVLGRIEFETGDWLAARALSAEGIELSRETQQWGILATCLIVSAMLDAAEGRERDCRAAADEALELAHAQRSFWQEVTAHGALGLLELSLGRPEAAIRELTPVVREVGERRIGDPQLLAPTPDLVEALVRCSQAQDAEQLLLEYERLARESGLGSELIPALRCQGLLAADGEFDLFFSEALEHCGRVRRPFERARTELCFGERLRRAKRRIEARTHLRSALAEFERLGAAPWAHRARVELRASGETIRRPDPADREELTPQELKVAMLVAEGLSNREAAAALFLSPKTVEAHLGRTFRKLGLRSRSELVRIFAAERHDTLGETA